MISLSQIRHRGSTLEKVEYSCCACGARLMTYPRLRHVSCNQPECRLEAERLERADEFEQLRASMPERVARVMSKCGMGRRELEATREGATPILLETCRPHIEMLLKDLKSPSYGFGIIGSSGCGKSGLLAWLVREWAGRAAQVSLESIKVVLPKAWSPCWAKWPEMLTDLQASIRDGYHLEEHMERLATVPLLVLDDLGAERAREDRDRDWGNVKLYEVLEARVNAQRATLWTSNLDGPAIRSRYGDRLLSRLIGLGPVVSAPPGLPDRRIASTMEKQRLGKDKDLIPWRPTTGA